MRTVYVDAGPIAHLTGKGSLKGHSMLDSEALVSPKGMGIVCLLYTSPSPRDATLSRMPSSA